MDESKLLEVLQVITDRLDHQDERIIEINKMIRNIHSTMPLIQKSMASFRRDLKILESKVDSMGGVNNETTY